MTTSQLFKRPTITAIRNKLEKKRLYEKFIIPDLEKIGCEIILARYGEFNPLTPWIKREKFASWEPELFYRIPEHNPGVEHHRFRRYRVGLG